MGFIKNLFDKFLDYGVFAEDDDFLWDEDAFWHEDDEEEEIDKADAKEAVGENESPWDWDTIVNERTYLKVSDPYQREKLIRSLVVVLL